MEMGPAIVIAIEALRGTQETSCRVAEPELAEIQSRAILFFSMMGFQRAFSSFM